MNNTEAMNWQKFKNQLTQYPDLYLQFQYAESKWVDASYHITEIKQAPIISVDCGGVMNSWTEIIIQLWEPGTTNQEPGMQVSKALSIINLVENKLQLNPLGVVKIEFGNSQYDTRQMYPGEMTADGENLIIDLRPDFTQCKAIERGGSCGTTTSGEECCAPVVTAKPKVELKNLAMAAESCCTPGSGCC
ncbi:DUF6428 family protein [Mucilaginibacter paludis]|uniref:Uncharacterized protein n=1 Tax=Mucilaginibacter paludis DSM 18603 TaxID=714943 RepID=H1YEY1_9SPHI|nr:DUF6428 family protein [Mucilaginibacter paludis]EHQ24398.1 hypothetical protein Mucpa_0198 [Mucilaginibacter paludis DSM 18603]